MSTTFNLAGMGSKMAELLQKELHDLALHLSGEIRRNSPVATAALAGSWWVSGIKAENGTEYQVGSPRWDQYGSYAEFGTKPHWMPIEPLVTWVREKGLDKLSIDIVPTAKGTMKRVPKQSAPDYREKKIRRIARAIQVKIAREGTDAQLYVLRSIQAMGLSYQVVTTPETIYYQIDPTKWLTERGFMAKLTGGV